ncbi:MAG: hypothetical protein M9894_32375 [Planctomycetes bacterium]|nr:hypothetical protein [Planctomycetota bacterium]
MSAAGEPRPPGRRAALVVGVVVALLCGAVVALVALRRGPVDLAPLEADLREARQMLGPSARAPWAEQAARDAGEHLRRAKAWNEALAAGASGAERDQAWEALRAARAASRRSLVAARDELTLLQGKRW